MPKQNNHKKRKKIISDEDVKRLILERLKVLSADTMISVGSEGDFSRDEMVELVEKEDNIGNSFAETQMDWLQSFQEAVEDE